MEFIEFQHREKILSDFFGYLINLAEELEIERDNFFEMLKELSTKEIKKKINDSDKLYNCIKEMYLMILLKILICDSLRERCYEDIKKINI
ncbi:hypothetical protein [Acanthamoeba polyphaga mimivirus]|uniref:Uncharacterized protein n=2 Tax=Acanthamoeba polyphaga mimivirus TaxID=212035 RepID=A0A0G2Y4E5_MIMIV|nr:hypothetical protein [Acanthamoeba polyphaga mimivirus]UMZ08461.1 hypothetical protein [Acanthamoeba polyphaga mimivirus]